MKIRITKKGKILLFVLLGIVILGSGGYLLWRVLQPDTIAPTDSDAGGGNGICCVPTSLGGPGCVSGYTCKPATCSGSEGLIPYLGCTGTDTKDGFQCCGTDLRCRNLGAGTTSTCNLSTKTCTVSSEYTCVEDDGDEPPTEGDCKDFICEWPEVVMSGRNDPSEEICRCEPCTGKVSSDPWSCTGNPPSCTPPSCPTGYESCGTSVNHESGSNCVKNSSLKCVTHHPDCNNPSYVFTYCKQIVEETPLCGDGILGNTSGEQCELGNPTGVSCTWDTCNQSTCTCPEITTPSCGDGILGNTDGEQCELNNPTGVSCMWDTCNQSSCTCPIVETNPDWDISKVGVESCVEQGEIVEGKITYNITVTNTGDAQGSIDKVVDVLDSKVLEGYIFTISSPGMYSSGSITWDLQGDDEIFDINETQTYTYYIQVPSTALGIYENIVTAYPREGNSLSAIEIVDLICEIPEIPDIPQTGIFDNSIGRILSGAFLILIGIILNKSDLNLREKILYSAKEYISEKRIRNFERKVRNN